MFKFNTHKKNKIIFFSAIDGVAETNPIQEASKFKFNWVEAAKEDYRKRADELKGKNPHIYRCPGIFDLMSTGYIVPLSWDVIIETQGDDAEFSWTLPTGIFEKMLNSKIVDGHFPEGIAKHLPKKPGSLSAIVKINSPWHVVAPEGVKFLVIPLPYPDDFSFEHTHGILDPSISTETNLQFRWNKLNGTHMLKAGTPMCQLIPLSSEKFDLEVRDATEEDKEWLKKRLYINNHTFVVKRPSIKAAYTKFLSRWM
jgi:hypothetical protein